ncbi:hypothetical protein [Paenibacillus aestuarii]|uniref:DUF4025 domain-containing protein n=1 Tax=Paenibacillus aestuarii TaxID=516965 RepID=A0ABW0K6W1_9BACL|nr:hypothetical protein [Paenibacillus aestuarii]
MDEQKDTVTSYDPESGQSKEVNVVLDHTRNGGMAYSIEDGKKDKSRNTQ